MAGNPKKASEIGRALRLLNQFEREALEGDGDRAGVLTSRERELAVADVNELVLRIDLELTQQRTARLRVVHLIPRLAVPLLVGELEECFFFKQKTAYEIHR